MGLLIQQIGFVHWQKVKSKTIKDYSDFIVILSQNGLESRKTVKKDWILEPKGSRMTTEWKKRITHENQFNF